MGNLSSWSCHTITDKSNEAFFFFSLGNQSQASKRLFIYLFLPFLSLTYAKLSKPRGGSLEPVGGKPTFPKGENPEVLRESSVEIHPGLHLPFDLGVQWMIFCKAPPHFPHSTALDNVCVWYFGLLFPVTWVLYSLVGFTNSLFLECPSSLCGRQIPILYQGQF